MRFTMLSFRYDLITLRIRLVCLRTHVCFWWFMRTSSLRRQVGRHLPTFSWLASRRTKPQSRPLTIAIPGLVPTVR